MKTIIRNFLSVFRRFKMATLLNFLGLSVAFTAFIVLMMQVKYEWGYDRFHQDVDCIYRLGIYRPENGNQVVLSRPLIDEFIASSPHIRNGALIQSLINDTFLSVEQNGERIGFKEPRCFAYPSFAEVFNFEMSEGERLATEHPETVIIPESMAQKFFRGKPALGKQLFGEGWTVTIGGVYKDFPENSIVRNVIYQRVNPTENVDQWRNQNYHLYLLLDSPEAKDELIPNFMANKQPEELVLMSMSNTELRLTWLPDIYYETDALFDTQKEKGSRTTVLVLFAISLLILLIAGINFTNFSNAMIPMRMKSINTQKVLGSSDKVLRWSVLIEAIIICVISFAMSLVWIAYLSHTKLTDLVSADMSFEANIPVLVLAGVLSLIVGLFSGFYPARLITSFSPALVLKGSFGLSPSGRKMRNVLIGFQFISSFALIIVALFIYMQNRYMVSSPLGFDKDQIAIITTNRQIRENKDLLSNRLKNETAIEDVSFAQMILAGGDNYNGWGRAFRDKNIQFTALQVAPNFLQVMDIPVGDGRDFRTDDIFTPGGAYVFNEAAKHQYNLKVGEYITGNDWISCEPAIIAGFVDDIKFASFRTSMNPMAFYVAPEKNFFPQYAYIKIRAGSDIREAVRIISKALTDIDPDYPVEISFYDTVLDNLYRQEKSLGMLIALFSIVAVFISIVGVFGLVLFDSQYRTKEIAIRKVHGATTGLILALFNNKYIRLLFACFILSIPIAYYAIAKWLENFAYKIPIYWWVFVVAFLVVTLITTTTVTFQSWRVANANPADSIKAE